MKPILSVKVERKRLYGLELARNRYADPEWCKWHLKQSAAWLKKRKKEDPEYHKEFNRKARERYRNSKKVRDRQKELAAKRWKEDDEWREALKVKRKKRWHEDEEWREEVKRKWRERYANDPEFREFHKKRNRESLARKRKEKVCQDTSP